MCWKAVKAATSYAFSIIIASEWHKNMHLTFWCPCLGSPRKVARRRWCPLVYKPQRTPCFRTESRNQDGRPSHKQTFRTLSRNLDHRTYRLKPLYWFTSNKSVFSQNQTNWSCTNVDLMKLRKEDSLGTQIFLPLLTLSPCWGNSVGMVEDRCGRLHLPRN